MRLRTKRQYLRSGYLAGSEAQVFRFGGTGDNCHGHNGSGRAVNPDALTSPRTVCIHIVEGLLKMKRRDLLISTALVAVAVASARGLAAGATAHVAYTPHAFAAAKAGGKPFMLDFFASW
jgi:hypothetical protein